ncbi:unnamed protein product [Amoebophrya sp. A25]|nr:unnamed protein product [Amoebophrya sp. A25]|eukprot:GSA25T00020732001.1
MPESRVYNFSAGPCIMPVEVLEECKQDMLNYKGAGMGVMEMSHRSKDFVAIYNQTEKDLRDVLAVPDNYKVLFQQGGASLQFAAVPMNFFGGGKTHADYAVTGQWTEKAVKEAQKYGTATAVCNTKPEKFTHIPPQSEWKMSDPETTAYFHYCDNETVNGVEFGYVPEVSVPLVGDMSSNFLTRPVDVSKFAMIYAGAQKNAGPAGNTICIIKDEFIGKQMPITPTVMSWKSQCDADGMYNTPPCYSIYVTGVYLKYTKSKGGLAYWADQSAKKSSMFGFSLQRTLKQFGDNQGAIKHVTGNQPVARLKHVVIRSAYIKELINTGEVQVFFLESAKNRSNVLSNICRGIEFKRGLLQLKLLQVEAIDAEAE